MLESGFSEKYEEFGSGLSEAVCRDYEAFANPDISLLKFSENVICLVKDKNTGERAVLRIHRPGYHTSEELLSELLFITEINQYSDVNTAHVYKGKDGNVMHTFKSPKGYEYTYSIQEFLEGVSLRSLDAENKAEQMKKVGCIAAKLHTMEAERPHYPEAFKRFTWDLPDTLGEKGRWGYYLQFPDLTAEEYTLLKTAGDTMKEEIEAYGRASDRYGLIHSDLHSENLLVNGDRISLIDFDDCGYGWYLYDLGSAVSQQSEGIWDLVNSYLEGYEQIRPLTEEDKAMVETFVLLRRMVRMGWMASHEDNGILAREGELYKQVTLELAHNYMESRRG